MKYFIDTEFHEGFHKPLFGRRRHFIDLISIAIVCEDGREFYAVSNEFDLDRVWRDDWLQKNVLKPIHDGLVKPNDVMHERLDWFTKGSVRELFDLHGQSNKEIARDIVRFIRDPYNTLLMDWEGPLDSYYLLLTGQEQDDNPQFYAYYADYDWVLFCSLFGRMIDLPKGFPMYCRDIKQIVDEKVVSLSGRIDNSNKRIVGHGNFEEQLAYIKSHPGYPTQSNAHNALDDARWNKKLYDFIQTV